MCSVFLDDGVDEVLGGGTPPQEPHASLEFWHEGDGISDQVPPLDGGVPHLPTCKFPADRKIDVFIIFCTFYTNCYVHLNGRYCCLLKGENHASF